MLPGERRKILCAFPKLPGRGFPQPGQRDAHLLPEHSTRPTARPVTGSVPHTADALLLAGERVLWFLTFPPGKLRDTEADSGVHARSWGLRPEAHSLHLTHIRPFSGLLCGIRLLGRRS